MSSVTLLVDFTLDIACRLSVERNIYHHEETQSAFTSSKLTIETVEQGVKYVQS